MANQLDEIVDFRQFFFKLIKNWFLLVISLLLAFLIAFAYIRYTTQLFSAEISIIVKDDNSLLTASGMFESMTPKTKSFENKKYQIKSFPLVYKTLEELKFDIGYFIEGNIKVTEAYEAPIIVKCTNVKALKGKKIKIDIIDDNRFSLIDISTKKEQIRKFNENFLFNDVGISVEYNINYLVDASDMSVTIVKFYDLQSLTLLYQQKIVVSQEDKESTVIDISILTEDEKKGVVFLNKLIDNYIESEVAEKNLTSNNTVSFINEQLTEMSDSLALIEQQIQQYKNNMYRKYILCIHK